MEQEMTPMFETSPTTEKIDVALAKVQAEVSSASKDKTNPHYRSKYADLASVWEACRDALTKHGVSVTQWPVHSDDNRLHMITRLACEGEWMRGHFSIPVNKADAHGFGSATTYAKRFALSAAVGVVADDDDDGNAASSGKRKSAYKAKKDGVEFGDDEGVDWGKIQDYIRSAPVSRMAEVKQRIKDNANAWPESWVTSAWELYHARQDELGITEAAA